MGSSELAGTKGKPATPRDGSAVEIVGLSKSALSFLGRMHREGHYSFNSVERQDETGVWLLDLLRWCSVHHEEYLIQSISLITLPWKISTLYLIK